MAKEGIPDLTLTAALPGYKTYDSTGIRIGAQSFLTLDVTMAVGQIQESLTVDWLPA